MNIIINNMRKEILQLRPLYPSCLNQRYQEILKDEHPEYTLVEVWKNG